MSNLSPAIRSNTAHVRNDALSALTILQTHQSSALSACGRAYLENLLMWRDRYGYESPPKKPRYVLVVNPQSTTTTMTTTELSPQKMPGTKAPRLHAPKNQRPVCPKNHPETLMRWRARMIEWMFQMADSQGMDRNTAVAASQYMDAYGMFRLFPREFERYTGGEYAVGVNLFSYEDEVGSVTKDEYVLGGVACFFIASKFYQTDPHVFTVDLAVELVKGYTVEDVVGMESAILNTLKFNLNGATHGRFINEMLPLLLDDERSLCYTGYQDKNGCRTVKFRNECDLGTFSSTLWFPQSDTEVLIENQAIYLADLLTWRSADYPHISTSLPSKIALAALLEACYENIEDADDQDFLQDRLAYLSQMNQAFDRDDEIEHIREAMRSMLHENGSFPEFKAMDGTSPVTILDFDDTESATVGKKECASVEERITFADDSQKTRVNFKPIKDRKKEPVISQEAEDAATVDEVELPTEGLVLYTMKEPHKPDLNKRPSCFACLGISNHVKTNAFIERVPDVVFE